MDLTVPIRTMKQTGQWPLPWTSAIGLVDHIKNLGDDVVGCELGVSYGFNLVYFLDNLPNIKKVYAIDPYAPYDDGPSGWVPKEVMDRVKSCMLDNIEENKDKVVFLEKSSDEAHSMIEDNSLDYIFIDGDHNYEAVIKDVHNYYSKVKSGGIFAGHDKSWPGVTRAINEFRSSKSLPEPSSCANDCWFWIKP